GVGPNKLVAKLASKAAKPAASRGGPSPGRGVVVVAEGEVLDFIWPMPVEALWGVGPASARRLHSLGIATIKQLAAMPESAIASVLGPTAGHAAHELAWGKDPRPVEPDRPVKSIGHEETYPVDRFDREELRSEVARMADDVASRVRRNGTAARTVTLKVRYGDWRTLTRSHTFAEPQVSGSVMAREVADLLARLDLKPGVRLLGVSASGLVPCEAPPGTQLRLGLRGATAAESQTDEDADLSIRGGIGASSCVWNRASEAIDAVRARFGETAIAPAVSLGREGIRLKRRGENQWGPGEDSKERSEPKVDTG
ncbi:MAG TPA: hypothetical protein VED59_04385, partial [Acidimicrobiales bacterium]|nr:hypothetical protein [Acidimicrobiales bacterium]